MNYGKHSSLLLITAIRQNRNGFHLKNRSLKSISDNNSAPKTISCVWLKPFMKSAHVGCEGSREVEAALEKPWEQLLQEQDNTKVNYLESHYIRACFYFHACNSASGIPSWGVWSHCILRGTEVDGQTVCSGFKRLSWQIHFALFPALSRCLNILTYKTPSDD